MSGSGACTMGVRAGCLATVNPNELVTLLKRDDLEKARQFARSEDSRKDMERAGVFETRDVCFLDESKG
jgi:hypothetical protein